MACNYTIAGYTIPPTFEEVIYRIEKKDFNTISGKSYGPEKNKRTDRHNEGK